MDALTQQVDDRLGDAGKADERCDHELVTPKGLKAGVRHFAQDHTVFFWLEEPTADYPLVQRGPDR